MSVKHLILMGVKVLTAAAVGIAVFIGLGKIASKSQTPEPAERNDQNSLQQDQQSQNPPGTPKIVNHLRSLQETCGKIFCLAQSLSTMAESVTRIFAKAPEIGFSQNLNYSYGTGCTGFTRLSPYVIEAGCNPNAGYYGPNNNKYRF